MLLFGLSVLAGIVLLDAALPFLAMRKSVEVGRVASLAHAGRSRYISPMTATLNLAGDAIIMACAIALYATV